MFFNIEIPSIVSVLMTLIGFSIFVYTITKFSLWKISPEVKNEKMKRIIEDSVIKSRLTLSINLLVFFAFIIVFSFTKYFVITNSILYGMVSLISIYNLRALNKLTKDIDEQINNEKSK